MMMAAQGTLAAIAQAFGGKSVKAMAAFRRSLGGGGSGASASDSGEMGRLRDRIGGIQQLVNQGRR